MRLIPAALQAHLDSGATTLAWCWRITRRDGVSLGFTDHDRDLAFDGTAFEAASGFTASEMREQVGLNVDSVDVEGALRSDKLTAADLEAGLYDDADIEIIRVNWQDVTQRVLIRAGSLGEIRRGRLSFSAEVRSLAHYLQQPQGRLFQYACDADLGDSRCGVDLSSPTYRGSGTITASSGNLKLGANGLAAYAAGWFSRGRLTWTSGANAGLSTDVKRHTKAGVLASLELWQRAVHPIFTGDAFTITAGCDKRFQTCKTRFANTANYRGFPHMPGNDFVTSYPNRDDGKNDGGALT